MMDTEIAEPTYFLVAKPEAVEEGPFWFVDGRDADAFADAINCQDRSFQARSEEATPISRESAEEEIAHERALALERADSATEIADEVYEGGSLTQVLEELVKDSASPGVLRMVAEWIEIDERRR